MKLSNNKHNLTKSILFTLCIFALGALVVLLFGQIKTGKNVSRLGLVSESFQQANVATPNNIVHLPLIVSDAISKTPIDEPTKNWVERYESQMGIKFYYPSGWHIDHPPGLLSKRGALILTTYQPDKYEMAHERIFNEDAKVILAWVKDSKGIYKSQDGKMAQPRMLVSADMEIITETKVFIAQRDIIMVTKKDISLNGSGSMLRTYYILVNGQMFEVTVEPYESIYLNDVEQLISTLEFIQ